jgi:hemerythrin
MERMGDTMDLYTALLAEHRSLDGLLEELLNHTHVGDTAAMDATWSKLDRSLSAHLETEERWMLPIFERGAPEEAAAVWADHEKIRALLAEIGVGIELHVVREETIEALARFLRAHAAREEASLYRWAKEGMEEPARHRILAQIASLVGRKGDPGRDDTRAPELR